MVSNNGNNEQRNIELEDDGLPPFENMGDVYRREQDIRDLVRNLSEDKPTFLVGGSPEIKIEITIKQKLAPERVFDLDEIARGLEMVKTDSVWNQSVKNHQGGLVVILFSDDEGTDSNEKLARAMFKNLKGLEMTSVYYSNCNFGVPNFENVTDKASLEKTLKEAYSKIHSVGASLDEYKKRLEQTRNEPPVPTGYKKLDEILDGGIYPGLYLFGADTSLGKTTFWLNVAVNASNLGRSVMYFSIEMSKFELNGRMLSRETYELSKYSKEKVHPQTERTLTNAFKLDRLSEADKKLVEDARTLFSHKARNLYIFEGIGEMYVDTIRNAVIGFMERTGTTQPPLVIVDYVQILRHKDKYIDGQDKQKLDKNLFELKKLSNRHGLPLVCISSLNRDSYKNLKRITKTSFKESGAVEYTADTLIGMQLEKLAKNKELTEDQIEDETNKQNRELDMVILKNRHGQSAIHDHFVYNTWFNDFSEVPGFSRYPSKTDTSGYPGTNRNESDDDQDDDEPTLI